MLIVFSTITNIELFFLGIKKRDRSFKMFEWSHYDLRIRSLETTFTIVIIVTQVFGMPHLL